MNARANFWGAQAASLPVATACRDHHSARDKCHAPRCGPRTGVFPASCRKLEAGSLRSPGAWTVALLLLFTACQVTLADTPLAPATIVVFNNRVPESVELAKFYAQKRGIARDHLVGLACPAEEEISREDYDRTIADPLRKVFQDRKWWQLRERPNETPSVSGNKIRFVALIKGMPLKIRAAEAYSGDKTSSGSPIGARNEASVDSELSVLSRFSPEISGAMNNPYHQGYRAILEAGELPLMLVCRLDAPTAAMVRQMIVDAIETEKSGLWGRAFVDGARNTAPGFEIGDRWLREIVQQLGKAGVPAVFDDAPPIFADGYPVSDCALYYGWYHSAVAGPFAAPNFRFVPGAVAVHIHSYSAHTLRDPNANWAAPLLAKGAAAVLGNVYEPYLQLTTYLGIFNDRLLHGFTFAESAYMATPALSWMSVMIGDPLYRPYASWLQIDAKPAAGAKGGEWRMYHDFAIQNASKPPAEYRAAARQAASRARNGAIIEDLGGMEAREGNWASATSHFQQARAIYTKREDILRVVLAEADSLAKQGQQKRAMEVIRSVLRIVSDASTVALFRKVEQELSPAPAAVPPAKP